MRGIIGGAGTMEYRSISTLNDRVAAWSARLPGNPELIVGMAPDGLLPATLLALHRNLPVTDLPGLLEGRILSTGQRYGGPPLAGILRRPARIIVVDDYACTGSSLAEARERIAAADLPHEVSYGAVFTTPWAVHEGAVTHYAEMLPDPAVFEWNIMHTTRVESFCVDIDGVLCVGPEPSENDDGGRYGAFLRNARPLVLPRHEVGWLVTSRLERYRPETEDWLARHAVRYRHLLMMDYPNQAARQRARAYDSFKAAAYLDTGADLFIESATHTAAGIARIASRPVFCFATREMIDPEGVPRQQYLPAHPPRTAIRALRWGVRLPGRIVRRARRKIGRGRHVATSREVAD